MPVLVVAAGRTLAGRLALRLLDEGGQVRAVTRTRVGELRAAGVHVAVADPDDVGRIEAAATQVHTVVHLVGGLDADADAAAAERVVAESSAVVRAAEGAEVRRLVLVTMAGAAPEAADVLRRAHARAEAAAEAAAPPSIVVRAPLVDTPALRARLRVLGPEADLAAHAVPVLAPDDLVELVVALDRARSTAASGHLVLAATAARTMTLGELAAGGTRVGSRLASPAARTALMAALTGPWQEPDPTVPDAWRLLGIAPPATAGPGRTDPTGGRA